MLQNVCKYHRLLSQVLKPFTSRQVEALNPSKHQQKCKYSSTAAGKIHLSPFILLSSVYIDLFVCYPDI